MRLLNKIYNLLPAVYFLPGQYVFIVLTLLVLLVLTASRMMTVFRRDRRDN